MNICVLDSQGSIHPSFPFPMTPARGHLGRREGGKEGGREGGREGRKETKQETYLFAARGCAEKVQKEKGGLSRKPPLVCEQSEEGGREREGGRKRSQKLMSAFSFFLPTHPPSLPPSRAIPLRGMILP